MEYNVLSRFDDFLADIFLDGLHLWFRTIKMNMDHSEKQLPSGQLIDIIRRNVIDRNDVQNAVKECLALGLFQEYVRKVDSKDRPAFNNHLKRYINIYQPSAGFEISDTRRYSQEGEMAQACVIATKDWRVGDEVKFCSGVIACLASEDDDELKRQNRDFSVMFSTRKNCSCLFLGPARFMNHDCVSNCQFVPHGQNAITLKIVKDVKCGEELTTYYGAHYFGESNCECRCVSCERAGVGYFQPEEDAVITSHQFGSNRRSTRKRKAVSYEGFYPPSTRAKKSPTLEEQGDKTNTPIVRSVSSDYPVLSEKTQNVGYIYTNDNLFVPLPEAKLSNARDSKISSKLQGKVFLGAPTDLLCNVALFANEHLFNVFNTHSFFKEEENEDTSSVRFLQDRFSLRSGIEDLLNKNHEPSVPNDDLFSFVDDLSDLSSVAEPELVSSTLLDSTTGSCRICDYESIIEKESKRCFRCHRHYIIFRLEWPIRRLKTSRPRSLKGKQTPTTRRSEKRSISPVAKQSPAVEIGDQNTSTLLSAEESSSDLTKQNNVILPVTSISSKTDQKPSTSLPIKESIYPLASQPSSSSLNSADIAQDFSVQLSLSPSGKEIDKDPITKRFVAKFLSQRPTKRISVKIASLMSSRSKSYINDNSGPQVQDQAQTYEKSITYNQPSLYSESLIQHQNLTSSDTYNHNRSSMYSDTQSQAQISQPHVSTSLSLQMTASGNSKVYSPQHPNRLSHPRPHIPLHVHPYPQIQSQAQEHQQHQQQHWSPASDQSPNESTNQSIPMTEQINLSTRKFQHPSFPNEQSNMLNYSYSLSQIHNDHQTHPNHPYFQNYPSYVSQILSNAEYQPQSQSYYSSRSRSHCSVASFVDPIFSKGASSTTAYNQKENESYSSVQTQYYPQEQAYYNSHVYVQDAFSTGQNMYSSVGLPSKQTLSHYAYPSTTWENPTVLPLGDNPDFYQLQDSPEKPQRYNPWPEKPRSNPETPTSLSLELQVEKTMIAQNPQNSRKNKKQDFKTESPLVEKQEIPIGLPSEETMNEQENTLDSSTSNAFSIHQNRVDNLVPSLTKALTLISTKESVPTLTKVLTEALSTESVPHLARALALALAQASENNSKLRQGKEQGYSMHQNNFQDINQTLPMDPGHHSIVNESQTQGTPGTLSWSSHLLDHDQPNKNYTYRALGSQAHPSSFHVHSENSLPPVHEILGSQDRCIEKYESFSQKLQTCLEDDMNFSIYYPKQSQTDYYQYSNTHSQVVPHDSSYSQDCRGKPLKEYLLAEPSPFEKKSHHQEPTHSSHFGMGAQYTIQPQGSSQVNTFIETRPYVGTKTQTQTYTMKTPGHFQRERKAKGKPTEKLQGDHVKVPTRTRTRTRTQKKSQAQEHSEYDIPYSKGPLFNIKSEQLFLIQQQQPSQEEPEIKNDYYSQAKNDSSFKVKSPHLPPSIQAQDQTSLHSLNYSEHYDQKNEHEPNTFTSPAYGNNTPSRTYSGTQMHKQINNQEFTNTDRQKYMEMLQTQQKVRMRLEMRARTDIQVKTPLSFDDTGYYGQEDKQKPNTFTLPTYDNTMTSQTYPSSLMHKEVTTREPIHAGSKKPMPLMLQTQRDVAVQKYSQVEIPLSQSSDSMLYKVKDEAQVRFSFSSHSRTYSTPSQGTSPPVSQIIISQAHTYANQCANHWGRQTASSYKHLIGRAQVFGENYIKVYEKSYHDSLNYFIQSYQEPPKNIA